MLLGTAVYLDCAVYNVAKLMPRQRHATISSWCMLIVARCDAGRHRVTFYRQPTAFPGEQVPS